MDLRCPAKKHGELEGDMISIRCRSAFCGHEPGVVVIHRYATATGEHIDTQRFRDPGPQPTKEG